jgi:hypothetical protein
MPEQNRLLISPEDDFAYGAGIPRDATWRNLVPAAELGLAMAPGSGEAMAARDAWNGSGRGQNALLQGQYGAAAGEYGNMLLGVMGAIPGAGIIARGTKRGAAWMDRNLPQGFNRLLDTMTPKASQDTMYAIPAWHGSPHDFDEFKLDRIGTGEGAQAYGHGLYFAESPGVAKHYQEVLGQKQNPYAASSLKDISDTVDWIKGGKTGPKPAKADQHIDDAVSDFASDYINGPIQNPTDAQIAEHLAGTLAPRGRLYRTELDVEPEDLLDWDLPLSQQSEKIRKGLAGTVDKMAEVPPGRLPWMDPEDWGNTSGSELLGNMRDWMMQHRGAGHADTELSQKLREAGIPGIRYLDQGSRGGGEGTRNFVIFDDKLVKILGKE